MIKGKCKKCNMVLEGDTREILDNEFSYHAKKIHKSIRVRKTSQGMTLKILK